MMWGLAALCFLLLVTPTLVVIVVSFTSGFSLKFPPPGYSLRWYVALLDAWQLHFAASNSIKIAIGSTLLAVVLGVAAALAIARSEKWSAQRARQPVHVAAGVAGARVRTGGIDVLHAHRHVGVAADPDHRPHGRVRALCRAHHGRGAGAARRVAARELGKPRRVAHFHIPPRDAAADPAGHPGGGFIAFMSSFDNVPVSLFLRDARTDMLPIRMWQDLEGKLDVTIAAVSGVLIVVTLALMMVMERVGGCPAGCGDRDDCSRLCAKLADGPVQLPR